MFLTKKLCTSWKNSSKMRSTKVGKFVLGICSVLHWTFFSYLIFEALFCWFESVKNKCQEIWIVRGSEPIDIYSNCTQTETWGSYSFEKTNKSPNIFSLTATDGGYSDWSKCSECSVTCGGGTQTFGRTCTSPPPTKGGKDCSELGPNYKIVFCNEQKCGKCFYFFVYG